MRQEGSMEQDLGGAFITWTRSPEGPRDEGTRGTGNSILGSQEILLQPWEALPWSTGRRKTPSGTLQALHTHCVSGGMGSSASEGFPIPGFPTKPLEPDQELALALLGAANPGRPSSRSQELGLDQALAGGKNNPRGVERCNELRASIPVAEGSSTGTQPMECVHLHRSDRAPVMCLSTK